MTDTTDTVSASEALKPCPFCGSTAVRVVKGQPGCTYVVCEGCRASSDDTRGVEKWNTRATPPIQTGALADALGLTCEANNGGLHDAMGSGKDLFCPKCGLMLRRHAYTLPHVTPKQFRTALASIGEAQSDYVMVPRVPTEAMVQAGRRPERGDPLGDPGMCYLVSEVKRIYRAMIAASSSPAQSDGETL